MRWIARGVWLAVWIAWLAAGVGLYRELPRELGAAISSMPIPWKDHSWIGFVGDTNRFAAIKKIDSSETTIDLYDAETGALVYSKPGADFGAYIWPHRTRNRHPVVFAKRLQLEDNDFDSGPGICMFDLAEGKWRRLTKGAVERGVVHPSKPWIAFIDEWRVGGQRLSERVILLDWQTGSERVVREVDAGFALAGDMVFVADYDWLVVQVAASPRLYGTPPVGRTEIWKLGDPPALVKTIDELPVGLRLSVSANGRLAFANPRGTLAVDVYDLVEGRYVFSNIPRDGRPPEPTKRSDFPFPPTISPSGRRVFGGDPSTLWDVESGSIVWQGGDMHTFANNATNTLFGFERWEKYWKNWVKTNPYYIAATRDLETGATIVRTISSKPSIQAEYWNAARTLAVANTGDVYRLPLAVNWPLLAGCQAILAAPIVGLWSLLWWRRRRKLRAAVGAQPMR